MCGIFGFVGSPDRANAIDLGAAILALRHRGPDANGTHRGRTGDVAVAMAHTRLAIIDLSPFASQPMTTDDGRYTLVYNGEIYNFREIRAELETHGETFESHSDTRVLLRAYVRWGEQVVERLRGMFAFAVWDAHTASLFLVRDHSGIKPLYYAETRDGLAFSSELRTLMQAGVVERRLSRRGLASYLSFGSVYEPETILEGVYAFPPASRAVYRDGRLSLERYWSRPTIAEPITFEEAVGQIRPLLHEGVRQELVSDVSIGIFLSGGIDSSAIVALAAEELDVPPKTFTVTFDEAAYNEEKFAAEVASSFGSDHHQVHLSAARAVTCVDAVLASVDQPSADGVNTWFVAKAAREAGLTVALSGTGGDELFGGYETFRTYPRALRLPAMSRAVSSAAARMIGDPFTAVPNRVQKAIALAEAGGDPSVTYAALRCVFTRRQVHALAPGLDLDHVWKPGVADRFSPSPRVADRINEYSLLDQQNYLLNTLLRDTDAMSMAHSLEVRVPLLNHRLAELLMRVPGRVKLGESNKPLLTAAVQRLPADITARRKMGFVLPMEVWLRGDLRERLSAALSRAGQSVLDRPALDRLRAGFDRGPRFVSWSRLWAVFSLLEWMDLHDVA